jgi:hypothetical protein
VTQAGTFTVVGTGNPTPTLSMVGRASGGRHIHAARASSPERPRSTR